MTYRELFDLKFKKGLSTYELVQRYPEDIARVSEVALLDVPEEILKSILQNQKDLERLMRLKRQFLGN